MYIAQTAFDFTDIQALWLPNQQYPNRRGAFYKGAYSLLGLFVEEKSDLVPGHDQLLTLKKK